MKLLLSPLMIIFISLNISCQQNSQLLTNVSSQPMANNIDNKPINDSSINSVITCKSKELFGVWQELNKELRFTSGDCSDYIKIDRLYDLNHDGIKEYFVKGTGSWGAASTLPIWILQKRGREYVVIHQEQGEDYFVKKSKTNGYQDLFFPSRRNIVSTFLSDYKFQKGKYYRTSCKIEFYYDSKKQILDCDDEKGINELEDKHKSN